MRRIVGPLVREGHVGASPVRSGLAMKEKVAPLTLPKSSAPA